jgi:hypothetical protein
MTCTGEGHRGSAMKDCQIVIIFKRFEHWLLSDALLRLLLKGEEVCRRALMRSGKKERPIIVFQFNSCWQSAFPESADAAAFAADLLTKHRCTSAAAAHCAVNERFGARRPL